MLLLLWRPPICEPTESRGCCNRVKRNVRKKGKQKRGDYMNDICFGLPMKCALLPASFLLPLLTVNSSLNSPMHCLSFIRKKCCQSRLFSIHACSNLLSLSPSFSQTQAPAMSCPTYIYHFSANNTHTQTSHELLTRVIAQRTCMRCTMQATQPR